MLLKLYAVKDVLVGSFMNPIPMQNDEVAVRSLRIVANDPNSFKENKKDIQLWCLMSYDNETGLVVENNPYCVGNLIDYVEVKVNDSN